jgi:hypothetical protein
VCCPVERLVSERLATPLLRVTEVGEPSTVKTTVPAGVIAGPETVALRVTVWPYNGDGCETGESTMVDAG